jgi:hypothetical protein
MRNARKIKTFLSFSLYFHNGVPSTAGKRYEKKPKTKKTLYENEKKALFLSKIKKLG